MKHLFLIRHAKSSWKDEHLKDRERPLNARGESQVASLARAIVHTGALGGHIYCSEALRARSTLEGIIPAEFPENRVHVTADLYTFDYTRLLDWLEALPEDEDTVALIGHNPALLELAHHLLKHPPSELPTASILCIRLPDKPWHKLMTGKGKGRLEAFLTPRDYSYEQFARKQKKRAATSGKAPGADIPRSLAHQVKRMKELEPGVRTDLDAEFLHQFRIATRRSRAVADSVRKVTGDSALDSPLRQIKQHAGATSRLRDLHVFIHDLDALCGENFELNAALETWAQSESRREHLVLVEHLDSKRYRQFLQDWEDRIQGSALRKLVGKLEPKDIAHVVETQVRKFNRLTAELLHDSPDEDLHSLRKQLKRIRYLMELDADSWRDALKSLKFRQELYGRFQDLHVQIGLVEQFRREAPGILPAATEDLLRQLSQEKNEVRRQILSLGGLNLAQG